MQRRVWRTVGVVGDVIQLGVFKLKLRMKACHLQQAVKLQLLNNPVSDLQKIVEIEEILQHVRMNQQRRVHRFRIRFGQKFQLAHQLVSQRLGRNRVAHHVANLPLHMNGFSKRAQIEADHGALKPRLHLRNDGRVER